ncbi:MAG: tRNA 2-thiouridine(34) synthase MnmA [Calditrichaeota bacterium]|nr:tRNA 2-thiouridine(34) synthase MnmA [Calditrichota bacterium]
MKIAVLVSGGVDSSVALALLKKQGHDLTAFYLKVWMEEDFGFGECPWQEDVEYVRKVSEHLGIKNEIVPMQREYWQRVIEYTLAELREGRTPNPDMMCNRLIKFGAFHEKYAKEYDRIASGHYAKLITDDVGRTHLMTNPDPVKDQTYFLSQMIYEQISRSLFPLGDMTKKQVRQIAENLSLPSSGRPDSQGICFLGKINFRDFLKKYVGEKNGPIIEKATGKNLGTHKGFWFYTIGQRSGLNLAGGPWFVIEKDTRENIIYVSHGYDPEDVYVDEIVLDQFNWINPLPDFASGEMSARVRFKIRHSPVFYDGIVHKKSEKKYIIKPDEKIAAVAPGQFGVIYQNGECFGGGVICD